MKSSWIVKRLSITRLCLLTKRNIKENINTSEDIIEWMNEDVKMYADSTVFDSYIWNLEEMCEENKYILQTKYDY